MSIIFAVHFYRKLDRITFAKLLIFQIVVYLLIRLAIGWAFRNNPGGAVEFHLPDQLTEVMKHPYRAMIYCLAGVVTIGLMGYRWRDKPGLMRDAASTTVPILFALFLFFGWPFEIRVFYESYPIVLILCLLSVAYFFNIEVEMRPEPVRRLVAAPRP